MTPQKLNLEQQEVDAPTVFSPRSENEVKKDKKENALHDAYTPEVPDMTGEAKDHRTDFEHTLAHSMESEREEARIDRFLIKNKTN